jgi:translation initiation factor 1
MKHAMGKNKLPLTADTGPFHTPFAKLSGSVTPTETTAPTPSTTKEPASTALLSQQATLVLRCERKGRGGKTVTLIEGLQLSPTHMEELAKKIRTSLGCGAHVEENHIVIQGDHRERTETVLRKAGAQKVLVRS